MYAENSVACNSRLLAVILSAFSSTSMNSNNGYKSTPDGHGYSDDSTPSHPQK